MTWCDSVLLGVTRRDSVLLGVTQCDSSVTPLAQVGSCVAYLIFVAQTMRDVLWVHVPLEYVYAAIFPPVRLTRLAPAMSVCSLPLRDWLPLRA